MKKYRIAEGLGNLLCGAAVIVALMTMCIDIDKSAHPVKAMLIGWGVVAVLAVLGVAMLYLSLVEGVLLASLIIVCAFMYRLFRCPIRFMRYCYKIKRTFGPTYRGAFLKCVDKYDLYIFEEDRKAKEA